MTNGTKQSKPPASGWTWIDNQVFSLAADIDARKRASAIAVYLVLAKHADNETRKCFPSQEDIAEALGVSKDTVQRAIKALKAVKLISWELVSRGRGKGCFNVYSLELQSRTDAAMKLVTKPHEDQLHSRIPGARTRLKELYPRTRRRMRLRLRLSNEE